MLRRFYTKRSGFTLVELVVAFAVFAIMAGMVGQILQLSIRARLSNNDYGRQLAEQEQFLTVVERDGSMYGTTDERGKIELNFNNGTNINLPYTMLSAVDTGADGVNSGEGLNYFVSNVNYGGTGGGGGADTPSYNTGTQLSRYDTRITGTAGIGQIIIYDVVKDTHDYSTLDPTDPLYLAPGNTRYIFRVAASTQTADTPAIETFNEEDGPYAQYRLYFYMGSPNADDPAIGLSPGGGDVEYTDENDKTYTKDVYTTAKILNVGYINSFDTAVSSGVNSGIVTSAPNVNNIYTIEQMNSFTIRIGTPFVTSDKFSKGESAMAKVSGNTKGYLFSLGYTSKFYVDFEGDPQLTTKSFGRDGEAVAGGGTRYTAAPVYRDEYDSSGNPTYNNTGKKHVNIYGAYINKRNYK